MQRLLAIRLEYLYGASGVFFGITVLTPYGWLLALPALLLFIHAYRRSTPRQIFWGSWVVGLLKSAGALSWLWSVYPIVIIPIASTSLQLSLIGLLWLYSSMALGLGFALLMYSLTRVVVRFGLYVLPFVWISAELCGALVFSLASYGPGATINANFSFGFIGYLVADLYLLFPLGTIAGVFGYSLFSLYGGVVVYRWIEHYYQQTKGNQTDRWVTSSVLGVSIVLLILWCIPKDIPVSPQVVAIDTMIPDTLVMTAEGRRVQQVAIRQAVITAITKQANILALPEGGGFTHQFSSTAEALFFLQTMAAHPLLVIDSTTLRMTTQESILRAFIYDTQAGNVLTTDKQYLVPQGEFLPYIVSLPVRWFGSATLLAYLKERLQYQVGPERSHAYAGAHVPGVLFCMESINPFGVWSIVRQHPTELIVHQISHVWFHEPTSLWLQQARMLRTQALFNQVTIVEAANMKSGVAYYPDGTIGNGEVVASGDRWVAKQY